MEHKKYRINHKCSKCGVTADTNPTLTFHRFPIGEKSSSLLQLQVWAEYCFPDQDWSSTDKLQTLWREHKMLCSKHFDSSSFTDRFRKRLKSFAVPTNAKNILQKLRKDKAKASPYPYRPLRRSCEICGCRSMGRDGKKLNFMARFPIDEVRCKQWVKMTGKEDLAYLPIEKLHQLKFLCGMHFDRKYFTKMKMRLKRNAVPSINLSAPPLPDSILSDFPCHIYSKSSNSKQDLKSKVSLLSMEQKKGCKRRIPLLQIKSIFKGEVSKGKTNSREHSYCTVQASVSDEPNISTVNQDNAVDQEVLEEEYLSDMDKYEQSFDGTEVNTDKSHTDAALFSWQKKAPIVCDEDVCDPDGWDTYEDLSMYNDDSPNADEENNQHVESNVPQMHEGYTCNGCEGTISGFRYTCVQCEDYDLCEACEARHLHMQHYMLRVPGPRPQGEVKLIINTIKRTLNESTVEVKDELITNIKEEVDEAFDETLIETLDESFDEAFDERDPLEGATARSVASFRSQQSRMDYTDIETIDDDALTDNGTKWKQKEYGETGVTDSKKNLEDLWSDEEPDIFDIEKGKSKPSTRKVKRVTLNSISSNNSSNSTPKTGHKVIKIKCYKPNISKENVNKCFVIVNDILRAEDGNKICTLKIKNIKTINSDRNKLHKNVTPFSNSSKFKNNVTTSSQSSPKSVTANIENNSQKRQKNVTTRTVDDSQSTEQSVTASRSKE
ncbi:uncharacterized protein LOC113519412 isoform X2 [Galleria mellonella]|uniref:Uncharacterized protein LOC113519412 isoform X2 n=1 Tax=Galleria mellonella TaxID=7137 RepID=A0ABM3MNU3_GALME|nr:uncharacterized protein LOC113519412 isoform X2 [Galleria mellonella]